MSEVSVDPAFDRAMKRRPSGWVAPGPRPRGDQGRPELAPSEDEDLSFLTGDFRIFQRKRGHRWSLDDFVTALYAHRAARAAGAPARYADIGCGIGSVLMMVSWACPETQAVGVEAQELSVSLARRSLVYNGIDERVRIVHGDLRSVELEPASFDLVTGTPPYLAIGNGLVSEKEQRGPCCFETRGGIEDYCLAASRLLRPNGLFVVCGGALPEEDLRGENAALGAGLSLVERIDVVPRAGKAVLLRVFVMKLGLVSAPARSSQFVVRDASLAITDQMRAAREEMGLPPVP